MWALAQICWGKAEHVQANWQDDQLARDWNANAAMLINLQVEYFIKASGGTIAFDRRSLLDTLREVAGR
jgi:hypothetical protein